MADAVKYTQQSKTDMQKTQARTNIGAASTENVDDLKSAIKNSSVFGLTYGTLTGRNFGQGRYRSSDGIVNSGTSTLYIRTLDYLPRGAVAVSVADGYTMCIYVWDTSTEPATYKGVITTSGTLATIGTYANLSEKTSLAGYPDTYRFKVALNAPDSGEVHWYSDYSKIIIGFATDKKLVTEWVPADAKTVGDMLEVEYTDIFTTESQWTAGGINASNGNDVDNLENRIRMTAPEGVTSAKVINGANMLFWAFCWAGDTYQGGWTGSGFTTSSGSLVKYSELDFAPIYANGTTKIVIVAMVGTDNSLNIDEADGEDIEFIKVGNVFDRIDAEQTMVSNDIDFNMTWSRLFAYNFQKGYYNVSGGSRQGSSSLKYICTTDYLPVNAGGVKAAQGFKLRVNVWDTSGEPTYLGAITDTGIISK